MFLRLLHNRCFSQLLFQNWLVNASFTETLASHLIYALLQVSYLGAYFHSCALESQSLRPLPSSFFPLQAPHWVTPELRVSSDSVTWLLILNPSS